MTTRAAKWGNSIGIRLPAALAEQYGIEPGTEVHFVAEGRAIKIVPQNTPRRYELTELLAGITPYDIEPEIPTGPDRGREVIE